MAAVTINLPGVPLQGITSVSNIAALRALSSASLLAGQNIVVDSGAVDGDGLGAVFTWAPGATANDDGATIAKPSDRTPLQAGRWIALAAGFKQNSASAVARTYLAKLLDAPVSPKDFGAVGNGTANDTTALQAALDHVWAAGGGVVELDQGTTYRVTDTLIIGSYTQLRLNGARLLADMSDKPIVQASKDALTQGWSVSGPGQVGFATQQPSTSTNAVGFRLSKAGVNSYNFRLGDGATIVVENACTAFDSTAEAGSFLFVGSIEGVLAYGCSGWGANLDCDTTTGGGTNLSLRNVWALQPSSAPQANSKGFRIRGFVGLLIDNVIGDHLQNEWLYMESCDGRIGHIAFESCTASASSGQLSLINMIACPSMRIGEIYGYQNSVSISGSADCYIIRPDGGAFDINTIRLKKTTLTDTSSGQIYTVNPTTGTRVRNEIFEQTNNALSPLAENLADFGIRKKIERWNGEDRMRRISGGLVEVFTTVEPASETWAVGDTWIKTNPAAGGVPGGRCVTAGTPGAWKNFAALAS